MLHALYQDDGLSRDDVARLLDAFPHQSASHTGVCVALCALLTRLLRSA
jgi:hypothetical protein